MNFLKIWSKTLCRKSMWTPLGKVLVIKTKLLLLIPALVIIIYSIMNERRTVDSMYVFIIYLMSVD